MPFTAWERRELIDMIRGEIYNLVTFRETCRVSEDGESDAVKGPPADDINEQPSQDECGRRAPWGFDSRMPPGGYGICVAPGGGSQNVLIAAKHPKHEPPYADSEWSVVLHNEVDGTTIKLRTDGSIHITSAAGKDIVLNGGTLKVARQSDGVGWLVVTYATVGLAGALVAVNVQWSAVDPGPAIPTAPPVAALPGTYKIALSVTGGAGNVRA